MCSVGPARLVLGFTKKRTETASKLPPPPCPGRGGATVGCLSGRKAIQTTAIAMGTIGRCLLLALFAVDRPEKEKGERDATRQGRCQCRRCSHQTKIETSDFATFVCGSTSQAQTMVLCRQYCLQNQDREPWRAGVRACVAGRPDINCNPSPGGPSRPRPQGQVGGGGGMSRSGHYCTATAFLAVGPRVCRVSGGPPVFP